MPVSSNYRPDPLFAALGEGFADAVTPARFPAHTLRRRNQRAAETIGLGDLNEAEWEQAFARFLPLADNQIEPLAMRYHGHQFGAYNPDIGDGRGFLFAQLRDGRGQLLDLGTKGSGRTPYSRFGDGRLTLKGGVREVLAAEMLEALGVKTSRALALFETGEALTRQDEPSPTRASVLTRLSHSHIRIGTFQRLAYLDEPMLMAQLVDHVAHAYYPELVELEGEARVAGLCARVCAANAQLAAHWMTAGFVHGVLNTDNLNVTGESFDYGPWRFLPSSQPGFVSAYFDETGRYAFARQPEAVAWALLQLAQALALICAPGPLERALQEFAPAYKSALRAAMFARLAITEGDLSADLSFLQGVFTWLTESQAGWDQFFHDWRGGEASAARASAGPQGRLYDGPAFAPIRDGLAARSVGQDRLSAYFQRPSPVTMLIDEVEGLWAPIAERDDWSLFAAKLDEITVLRDALNMGVANPSLR